MPAAEPKIELREVSLALDGKAVLEQLQPSTFRLTA